MLPEDNSKNIFSDPGNTRPPHGISCAIAQGKDLLSVNSVHSRISFKYAKIPLNITEHHSLNPLARISRIFKHPIQGLWGDKPYPPASLELLHVAERNPLEKQHITRTDKNIFCPSRSCCVDLQKQLVCIINEWELFARTRPCSVHMRACLQWLWGP